MKKSMKVYHDLHTHRDYAVVGGSSVTDDGGTHTTVILRDVDGNDEDLIHVSMDVLHACDRYIPVYRRAKK